MCKNHIPSFLLCHLALLQFGCETGPTLLEKSAQSEELRKETTVGVALPSGCPTMTVSLPAGKTTMTISYHEPTTDLKGAPLRDLAYTTLYVSSSKGPAQSIRVWTNDPQGGSLVTIQNVVASAQEIGVCVTATNWARKESGPATPAR